MPRAARRADRRGGLCRLLPYRRRPPGRLPWWVADGRPARRDGIGSGMRGRVLAAGPVQHQARGRRGAAVRARGGRPRRGGWKGGGTGHRRRDGRTAPAQRLRRSPAHESGAAPVRRAGRAPVAVFRAGAHLRADDDAHRRRGGAITGRAAGRAPPARSGSRDGCSDTFTPPCFPTIPSRSARWSSALWSGAFSRTISCAMCLHLAVGRPAARPAWRERARARRRLGRAHHPAALSSRREPADRGGDARPHLRAARARRVHQLRIFHTLDLTTDGSFGVGAAVVAALLVRTCRHSRPRPSGRWRVRRRRHHRPAADPAHGERAPGRRADEHRVLFGGTCSSWEAATSRSPRPTASSPWPDGSDSGPSACRTKLTLAGTERERRQSRHAGLHGRHRGDARARPRALPLHRSRAGPAGGGTNPRMAERSGSRWTAWSSSGSRCSNGLIALAGALFAQYPGLLEHSDGHRRGGDGSGEPDGG